MADNIFTSVLRGALTRSKVEVATELKRGTQDVLGQATGGLLGTPQRNDAGGEGIGGVQRRPTAAEAAQQVRGGVNNMTQNVLNRFEQGRTQTPNLAETVGSIPGRILGAILPSQGTVDRLTGGARAVQATIADPASLVRGRIERQAPAPVEDRSTYSADAIREAREAGRDTSEMVQTPADREVATAAAPAAAAPPAAAPPERSFWQRLIGAASTAATTVTNTATAAVASVTAAASIAATPAPEPPAKPSGQGFVLVTPAEHAADLAAQAAAIQVTTPAVTPASTVAAGPVVTTSVDPATQFAAAASPAAAPAKPSPTMGIDATIVEATQNGASADRLETLRKAREQIANLGAPGGPG